MSNATELLRIEDLHLTYRTEGAEVPAMREAMTGQYQDYFVDSLKLSAATAVIAQTPVG